MNDEITLKIMGVILVIMGIVSAWKGDKELPKNGFFGVRIRSYPEGFMRWFKWVFAAAFIYIGISILSKT